MELSDEVKMFALNMQEMINKNMDKKGNSWENCSLGYLEDKAREHMYTAFLKSEQCPDEGLDDLVHAANYLMFLYTKIMILKAEVEADMEQYQADCEGYESSYIEEQMALEDMRMAEEYNRQQEAMMGGDENA